MTDPMSLVRTVCRSVPRAALLMTAMTPYVARPHLAQAQAVKATASAKATPSARAAPAATRYVAPRTPDGHPDLQGNWTNASLTPLERPAGLPRALSKAQAAALEQRRADTVETGAKASDPNRSAPPVGGDGSPGAFGNVGGYNYVWIDAGDHVAFLNGELRSSFIVDPVNGRLPALTPAARAWGQQRAARNRQFGQYDNPENRPLAERCIMSFGSNAGPPMLPNGFYNNNYTIVQTNHHVMIMTEMVHDVRIIKLGKPTPRSSAVRPWMGESWGRWDGDTLVVETTNFYPSQELSQSVGLGGAWGANDSLRVVEKFTRTRDNVIFYRFTVHDPLNFTAPWSGELPMIAMDEQIYEYACHEGNYALSNVLSGARAMEREAAAKKPKPPE